MSGMNGGILANIGTRPPAVMESAPLVAGRSA